MAIKKIRVKNFKSFRDLEVEFADLNILIGANASGKSNFVQIFKFLRDIRRFGLGDAISIQGGFEYLKNMNAGSSGIFSLEVVCDQIAEFPIEIPMEFEGLSTGIKAYETIYRFAIKSKKSGPGFEVVEDRIQHKGKLAVLEGEEIKEIEEYGQVEFILSNDNKELNTYMKTSSPSDVKLTKKIGLLDHIALLSSLLLFEIPSLSPLMPPSQLGRVFDNTIYDFDSKLPKEYARITGKAELEEDGRNLAIVLKNIIGHGDTKRKFFNLVTYLLPFVEDLDVEESGDKSFLFKLRETYSEQFLPASLISDGTVNMIALIIALYFEKKPLVIIEEPGRNVHPYLISKVVRMMEDASHNKQIIVTTHNPEMVRYADKKDILLISRSEEGFSSICRPSEKEDVKIFLEHGLRMEELYVDSFLEI